VNRRLGCVRLGKQQVLTVVVSFLSFERSLVQELGYNGYERLRLGFDKAFGGQDSVPTFPLVVDAGCGTGLVGEQVGMRSFVRLFVFLVFPLHICYSLNTQYHQKSFCKSSFVTLAPT
jgi:hypothetical protein